MKRTILTTAALVLTGGLMAGCQTHDDTAYPYDEPTRTGDPVLADPHRTVVSPIPGDTTGGGLPRDHRTGGGVRPGDTTPEEALRGPRHPDHADAPTAQPDPLPQPEPVDRVPPPMPPQQ